MKVFKYDSDANNYSVPFDWDDEDVNIDYVTEIADEYFKKRARVGKHWSPTFFSVVDPRKKLPDLGALTGDDQMVFSQRAVDALSPLLGESVELLPYSTEVGTYYLINVLDVGHYLDRERTHCREIVPDGRCAGIIKYVFNADLIQGKHIFRIPDKLTARFLSEEFISTCRKHNLTGIDLTDEAKVWDSATA
jgi:hypothetical protein